MSASFADLFRRSRFAALHPGQFIAPLKHGKTRHWGLKHSPPKDSKAGFITADYKRVTISRRKIWNELFPPPVSPMPIPVVYDANLAIKLHNQKYTTNIPLIPPFSSPPKYVADLEPQEFQKKLRDAKKLRKHWAQLVENGVYKSTEYYKVLNVSPEPMAPLDADGSGASFKHLPTYLSKEYIDAARVEDPEISEAIPAVNRYIKVRGRMLSKILGGYTIGLGGYVAFCAAQNFEVERIYRQSPSTSNRMLLEDYWVIDARINAAGKPEIHVSRKDPSIDDRHDGQRVVQSIGKYFDSKRRHYVPKRESLLDSFAGEGQGTTYERLGQRGVEDRSSKDISTMMELLGASRNSKQKK